MAGRTARWGATLTLGALWWWGILRLALAPDAGVWEGAVAAGGWGLSLLPVHCVPKARAARAVDSDQRAMRSLRLAGIWRRGSGEERGRGV
ncbi:MULTISPECIES: hypothetical protein [unclassified Streptomyces]|uniref:hypothetical protein n=1 Tax=unclassified Streptomyces TaxID=2593676 RepID=UPI0033A1ADB7